MEKNKWTHSDRTCLLGAKLALFKSVTIPTQVPSTQLLLDIHFLVQPGIT